jgi:hypothetical protein
MYLESLNTIPDSDISYFQLRVVLPDLFVFMTRNKISRFDVNLAVTHFTNYVRSVHPACFKGIRNFLRKASATRNVQRAVYLSKPFRRQLVEQDDL